MWSFAKDWPSLTGEGDWKLRLLTDTAWFIAASAAAFTLGSLGDQLFRSNPFGWRFVPPALQSSNSAGAINLVSIDETEALLSRSDVIVLDARPRVFYELGHLPAALSLPRETFATQFGNLESTLRAEGKTLVIYCTDALCEDGPSVARLLQQRGLQKLLIYPGGYAEWEAAGKTVEVAP